MVDVLDFGGGITGQWVMWDPDLALNPQYADLAHVLPAEHACLNIKHPCADNPQVLHSSMIYLDLPELIGRFAVDQPRWQVESWDPLTLSPSILCNSERGGCGLHGFIRAGRWVAA